ncbi:MAG: helix-turn-helix transcriptional regulator [Polyangiaceae bacterium]|nr:helix-turn-helix transcriptional regulator [Polyangiaceae bacterium]
MLALERPYAVWILDALDFKRPPWEILERRLPHYLLVLNYEGTEQIVVEKQAIEIPPKASYLIQPGVLTQRLGSLKGSRTMFVHFDLIFNERRGEYKNAYSYDSDLTERQHLLQPTLLEAFGLDLPVQVPKKLEPLFAASLGPIIHRWLTADPLDILSANHELQGLLQIWLAYQAPRERRGPGLIDPETRLRRADAAARTNLAYPFDVNDFAKAAGLKRAHFTRTYTELRGISPGKALRDLRLNEAERLLRNTTLPIGDIGAQVGYPNATVFARVFRERHGLSPSEWRDEQS